MEIEIAYNAVDCREDKLQVSDTAKHFELSATTHQTDQEPRARDKRRILHEVLHCEAASNRRGNAEVELCEVVRGGCGPARSYLLRT
jgi:hypothetical protein